MRTIKRGDSYLWTIVVTNNSEAFDLTNFYATMSIAKSKEATPVISIEVEKGEANNVLIVDLNSDITKDLTPGTYVFDVQINNTDTPPVVKTILEDTLVVEDDITKELRTSN